MIEIKALAREPGSRTKIAVYSEDQRIDCVGACVGVRGSRIKNILDEIGNERIDVVPFSDDMQVFIPNALQPAEVEEVILCQMLGKAIVLVRKTSFRWQLAGAVRMFGWPASCASGILTS